MSALKDLSSQLIHEGHVDELTLVDVIVHLLYSVWVTFNTAECVVGHWLIGGVETMLFWCTIGETTVLKVSMWMVCL